MMERFLFLMRMLCFTAFSFAMTYAEESGNWQEVFQEYKILPMIKYPYPDLAEQLKKEGKKSLPIFSYGSLMDVRSASETLSKETLSSRRPALAFGIKRVFDRDYPIKGSSKWGVPIACQARGMLNVRVVNDLNVFVNGVLIDVQVNDLQDMLEREIGYNLIPVIVADWREMTQSKSPRYTIAYTFSAPGHSSYTNNSILPRPGYYELSRDATEQFGPLFHDLWYLTTFMADGTTPITMWEDKINSQDEITQSVHDELYKCK